MLIKKRNLLPLSLVLFLLVLNFSLRAQEIPTEDNNKILVDSIDKNENLLDSNEVYKKQFDSLSKDGDWIKMKKSDFVRDLSTNTGEDLEFYDSDDEIYFWRPFCSNAYWNPYYNGSWVFSSYGWVWLSNYSWGWGPYNYGRWYFSNFYGWLWLPGSVWASNWVTWRYNNYYVGWYPTCPRIYWRDYRNRLCSNHLFAYAPANWLFVKKNNFIKKIDKNTIVNADKNVDILKNSQKIKTAVYVDPASPKIKYTGPEVRDISKETGEKISPKQVEVTNTTVKQYADDKNIFIYKKNGSTQVKDGNSNTKADIKSSKTRTKENNNKSGKSNSSTKSGTKKNRQKQNDGSKNNDGYKGNNDGNKSNTEKTRGGYEGNSDSKSNDGTKGSYDTGTKK